MIIEPCCIQNQLPALLKEHHDTIFYSNGDWGVEKLLFSVRCLIDAEAVEVLLMPRVDVSFCRYLRQSLRRNWVKGIFLCTTDDCSELISSELRSFSDRVLYVHRQHIGMQAYVRYSSDMMLAICGAMLLDGKPATDPPHPSLNGGRGNYSAAEPLSTGRRTDPPQPSMVFTPPSVPPLSGDRNPAGRAGVEPVMSMEWGKYYVYHGMIGGHGRKFIELMNGIVPLFSTSIEVRDHRLTMSEVKQKFLNRRYE